jgi:predicted aspartyl protease
MPAPFTYRLRAPEPDAPECDVTLSWNGRSITVSALIDSGAGLTTIPASVISSLSLQRVGDMFIRGAQGPRQKRGLYRANIEFLGIAFDNHPVVELDRNEMLVGRDILNKHRLLLDGPQLSFSLD